jgi:phospholipid/cholesterol/gamma-HCH transport system permease protein
MTIFRDIGQYLLMLGGMISRPENAKMYWKEFIHQCSEIGIGSVGIVVIISIFMGAVSTVQTAYQLVSPLIPLSVIAQVVRDTVILEFAPTLVCIVLAGVVGSKIASELGNMRVSEQIDALEIMGINTKTYLVLPKIIAALVCHSNACDNCGCTRNLGWQVSRINDGYCPSLHIRPGIIRSI